jgi:hypothetical protein
MHRRRDKGGGGDGGGGGGANQKEQQGLRDGGGKEYLEVGVGGEFLKERERCAHDAPLDGREDGGRSGVGERLRFDGQLIEEHGEAVLHHTAQRGDTHALAARRGQYVDEVDAVVTHDVLQSNLMRQGAG